MGFQMIEHNVDFCVVGGGMAGICAAVAAAHPVGDAVEAAPAVHQHVVLVLGAHEPAVAQRRRIDPHAPAPEQFREPVHVSSS